MIHMTASWPEALQWLERLAQTVRGLDPLTAAALSAPCVLAILYRSLTATLLSLLLALVAVIAFAGGIDEALRESVASIACLAGLLAVVQAGSLRRKRRQLGDAKARLLERQQDLEDVRQRYEREVLWRKASEKTAPSGTHPSQLRPTA